MELATSVSFDDTSTAYSAKTDKELRKAHFIFRLVNNPIVSKLATMAVRVGIALHLPIKGLIRATVFDHFCGGENIEDCHGSIDHLAEFGVKTILDYSVEGEVSEKGFELAMAEILRTIDEAAANLHIPFGVFKVTGIASADLLTKVQAGDALTAGEQTAWEKVQARVEKICQYAYDKHVPVLIDAEDSWLQNPIDDMTYAMMRKFNKEKTMVFNTYQMYRADMLDNLRKAFHYAAMDNYYLGAKLVRGAYMEKEAKRAKDMGYPNPICKNKAATDESFDKGLAFCIDNKQRVNLVCGSHNEHSNYYLTVLMEKHSMQPNDPRVWFAQLYGMSDNISFNLAKAGYNVVKYVPYGPVRAVMPYLIRRAEENTSVAGQSSRELTMIRKEIKRRKEARA
jgi:proline dehydrogenase